MIDAASVPVDRRARRVKTDRLDLEQLIRMLLALERGETRACRVVRVPSPAEEDANRQHRERHVLVAERTGHGNRTSGLPMALDIRGVNPRRGDFVAHLQTLRTGDGEPLPPHTQQVLRREHERLCLIERQIREIETTQAAAIKATAETTVSQSEEAGAESGAVRAALLMRLKGPNSGSAATERRALGSMCDRASYGLPPREIGFVASASRPAKRGIPAASGRTGDKVTRSLPLMQTEATPTTCAAHNRRNNQRSDLTLNASDKGEARLSEGTRRAEHRASPPEAPETRSVGSEWDGEAVLPFVGRIAGHVPGALITAERILTLDEDLHLADHAFVHAPGVKPLSACLPVVPLTMGLEIMAETAACLAPGFGLIGFEDVKATQWIELADTDRLYLRIKAKIAQFDAQREVYRIATAIHVEDRPAPAIQSCILFAPHYCLDLSLGVTGYDNVRVHSWSGEQIYEKRHMFHGPIYQILTGQILLHDRGAAGELLVKAPTKLFRSTSRPQLLTDPVLLDAVGQLLGIWAVEQRERQVFPIGMKKLELYRPTPPVGTRVPVRVEITREEAKTLYADAEIQDGMGAVWLRIKDWGAWKFRWRKRLMDFRRLPTRYPLSRPIGLPGLAPTAVCCMVAPTDVAGFDAGLLARFYLHMDEMWAFTDKRSFPRRQQQWLLGRIAAKDAVRAWLAQHADAEEMLHPAALVIENDQRGLPRVAHGSTREGLPKLSISHCEDCAIAIAHGEAVSVDIEPVRPRARAFLETIATDAERGLLCGCGSESVDPTSEWITRLWCAKEAAGKLLGTGMDGSPRAYELQTFSPDGVMHMAHRDSSRAIAVRTLREQEFIIAYAGVQVAASDQASA